MGKGIYRLCGIIGQFAGAVVLALGYKLFRAWISPDETQGKLEEN
jgi:hypothetical protein